MKRAVLNIVLGLAIVVSAIALVYVRHENRVLFREYAHALNVRDKLKVEWGRLQLELATWSENGRIERLAHQKLDMHRPPPDEIVVVVR